MKLLREEIYDARGSEGIGEKPKHLRQKQIQLYWYCKEVTQKFVPMRRSQESSSPNFLWRWKQALVVSSRGTAYLWDKILQLNPKIRGVRDTLKCELGKKEVWTPNVVLISELRESRVTCASEDSGDLSFRDACLGKPRSTNKRSFIPSNVDSRWKKFAREISSVKIMKIF